jgi:hypothetical protein
MGARSSRFRQLAGIAAIGCWWICVATPAACLTIDDFEAGAFALQAVASDGDVTQIQTGLDPGHVLAGERRMLLNTQSASAPATATLVLTPANDSVDFFAPAPASGFQSSTLTLTYLFSNLDLTAGGTFDRIAVDVSSVSGQVQLSVSADSGPGLQGNVQQISAPGTFTFLFADYFVVDFMQLDELRVALTTGFGASASVSEVAAIPEPSTGLLLALGLAALPVARGGRARPRRALARRGRRG